MAETARREDDDDAFSYLAFAGLPTFLSLLCPVACLAAALTAALSSAGQDTASAARMGCACCAVGCLAAMCFSAVARGPSTALQRRLHFG